MKKAVCLHSKKNLFSQHEIRESCFMVMSFCLSMHFIYENLKVGSMLTSSCIFVTVQGLKCSFQMCKACCKKRCYQNIEDCIGKSKSLCWYWVNFHEKKEETLKSAVFFFQGFSILILSPTGRSCLKHQAANLN